MIELTSKWFMERFGERTVELRDHDDSVVIRGAIRVVRVCNDLLELELAGSYRLDNEGRWQLYSQLHFVYILRGLSAKYLSHGRVQLFSGVTGDCLTFFP